MKMVQKLVSAATVVVVAALVTVPVFAKTTFDDMMFDLQTLGIMQGDENGELMLDKPVTRAEFAAITVRMMSMDNVAGNFANESKFRDVPDGYWAKNDINYLTSMNVINGTSDTTFSPEDGIDVNAASKILVCALGYDAAAKVRGDYPAGYISQANGLGILDGVDTSVNPLTRKEVAKMVFNSLDVDIMTITIGAFGLPKYETEWGNTFRNRFTNGEGGVLTKLTGIVTATADTYLNAPVSGLDELHIEINDAIYKISDPSYREYIGQKVDFFVEDSDSRSIISMQPSSENAVQTIDANDIENVSSGRVTYKSDSGRASVRYDSNGYFLYNNRIATEWNNDSMENVDRGTITFIDNDDDDVADVVIIKQYTSVIVNNVSVDTNTVYLKENQQICGNRFIQADENNDDRRVVFLDKDGNSISVSDIEPENILSCYVSDDEQIIEAVVNDEIISGTINQISDDYIVVDGKEYYLENSRQEYDINPSKAYDIYLNFNNEVAYIKERVASENYAYIINVYCEDDGRTYGARLVLPNTIQEKQEEEKDPDGGASKIVSRLACQNKEIISVPLASKVSIDGERINGSDAASMLVGRIVIYKTNSNGELYSITSPENIGTGRQKYYNSAERTFGKTSGGAFGVDMDTMTICIPKDNDNPSNEDLLTAVEMNNGQLYDVTAYDQDRETHMAKLIVVNMPMKAGSVGLINTKSKVGMVRDSYYEYDEDLGDNVCCVELLTAEGTEVSCRITEAAEQSEDFFTPMKGDLISYSLDIDYNIDNVKLLGSMSGGLSYGRTNPFSDYETFYGEIADIEYNKVSENLNRWVHVVSCYAPSGDNDTAVDYEILKYSGPPIFIYDTVRKSITFGTIDDIDIAGDRIFVSAANNSVRAVVALR